MTSDRIVRFGLVTSLQYENATCHLCKSLYFTVGTLRLDVSAPACDDVLSEPRAGCDAGGLGLGLTDVRLRTEDGVNVHGWYSPKAGARRALLFLLGNGGNIHSIRREVNTLIQTD